MSKYHKVMLDNVEYKMRDVSIEPFNKKVRIATLALKEKIIEKLEKNESVEFLKYLNNRIHFFTDDHYLYIEDKDLEIYINTNFYLIRNMIEINSSVK